MAGICFKADPVLIETQYTIEDPDLLQVSFLCAQMFALADLEVLLKVGLVPIQVVLKAKGNAIVALHHQRDVAGSMVVTARRRFAPGESHALENLSVGVLP